MPPLFQRLKNALRQQRNKFRRRAVSGRLQRTSSFLPTGSGSLNYAIRNAQGRPMPSPRGQLQRTSSYLPTGSGSLNYAIRNAQGRPVVPSPRGQLQRTSSYLPMGSGSLEYAIRNAYSH